MRAAGPRFRRPRYSMIQFRAWMAAALLLAAASNRVASPARTRRCAAENAQPPVRRCSASRCRFRSPWLLFGVGHILPVVPSHMGRLGLASASTRQVVLHVSLLAGGLRAHAAAPCAVLGWCPSSHGAVGTRTNLQERAAKGKRAFGMPEARGTPPSRSPRGTTRTLTRCPSGYAARVSCRL